MTDADRKRLAEFLGECWHEMEGSQPYYSKCRLCGMTFGALHYSDWDISKFYRTFTTWDDLGAVKEKLVEKKLWWKFLHFVQDQRPYTNTDSVYQDEESSFYDWLFTPARFCELAGRFLEEK